MTESGKAAMDRVVAEAKSEKCDDWQHQLLAETTVGCPLCGESKYRAGETERCGLCGADKWDHYDQSQCPIGNDTYSSTQRFTPSSKLPAASGEPPIESKPAATSDFFCVTHQTDDKRCVEQCDHCKAPPVEDELRAGCYRDKFGDIRWIGTGNPYKEPAPVDDELPPLDWNDQEMTEADQLETGLEPLGRHTDVVLHSYILHTIVRERQLRAARAEIKRLRMDVFDDHGMVTAENFAEMQQRAEKAEAELQSLREKCERLEGALSLVDEKRKQVIAELFRASNACGQRLNNTALDHIDAAAKLLTPTPKDGDTSK